MHVDVVTMLQVYRAVLKDSGEVVAVKVQRPNVLSTVSKDLYVLRRAAEVYQVRVHVSPGSAWIFVRRKLCGCVAFAADTSHPNVHLSEGFVTCLSDRTPSLCCGPKY